MVSHTPRRRFGNLCQAEVTSAGDDRFEDVVLPHLDAAHRLARWLLRNEHDAQDVVQEAALRAFRYFRTFTGGNGRAWFLRIVRHACWSRRAGGVPIPLEPFDEGRHRVNQSTVDPEARLMQQDDAALIERAMGALPERFRQVLVLREMEGLSYEELATVVGIPVGTVMSGLSRARQAFRAALTHELNGRAPGAGTTARDPRAAGRYEGARNIRAGGGIRQK